MDIQTVVVWVNVNIIRKYALGASVIAVIGNLFVLFVTLRTKEFYTSFYNWLVIFLALGDLIQAMDLIEAIIHVNYFLGNGPYSRVMCASLAAPQFFGIFLAECIISFMAVDRMVAITFPIFYRRHSIGTPKIRAIVAFSLAMAVCFGSLLIYYWGIGLEEPISLCNGVVAANPVFRYYYASFLVANSIFVVVLYLLIMHGVNKASKRLNNDASSQLLRTQKSIFKQTSEFITTFIILWGVPSVFTLLSTALVSDPVFAALSSGTFICGTCTSSIINVWINLKKNGEVRSLLIKYLPTTFVKVYDRMQQTSSHGNKVFSTASKNVFNNNLVGNHQAVNRPNLSRNNSVNSKL